jgi:hypothetical protein
MEQGASFSGFFERQGGPPQTVKRLTQSRGQEVARKVLNPIELMRIVGETVELAPRLGVHMRGKRAGLSQTEAAFNSRNATIDFAKMGSAMRTANMIVPFLNARLQGMLNTFGALRDRPARSSATVGYVVGLPVLTAYLHNRYVFPEVLDDLAQYERDSNIVLIYGDKKNEAGDYSQVVKIPKGDVGRIFGNPIEAILERLSENDPKAFEDLWLEVLSDISPIEFEREGDVSLERAGASVIPPGIRGFLEAEQNRRWYYGSPIMSKKVEAARATEEITEGTPPWIVKPAQAIGVSPARFGHVIEAQFGGAGRQFARGETPFEAVARRFKGARGGRLEDLQHARLDEIEEGLASEGLNLERTAERTLTRWNELSPAQKTAEARELQKTEEGREVLAEMLEIAKGDSSGLKGIERRLKRGTTVKARARLIMEIMQELPREERYPRYRDWKAKKIITEAVERELGWK